MYKSIDLFAGIGGIRKGFDNAFGKDIETVFVSELDEFAQKTYKANFADDFVLVMCYQKADLRYEIISEMFTVFQNMGYN